MSCVLLNLLGRLLQFFCQILVSSLEVFIKVRIEYRKKIIVLSSGNGKGPHVSRSVIEPFLPGLFVGARARLLLRAMGSM